LKNFFYIAFGQLKIIALLPCFRKDESLPARAGGQKFLSSDPPFLFARLLKPPAIFSACGTERKDKKTKEVKTLAPPSRARLFESLLPKNLTALK